VVPGGLSASVGREIEHEPSGRDVGQVLNRSPISPAIPSSAARSIGDSHTIGLSAEDRIAVRRATSRRFTNVHPQVKVLGHSTSAAVDVARPGAS
jgi:hypothetical protein